MSKGPTPLPGSVFSHGTSDCRDAEKTQRFLQEFLGIHSVRKSKGTQYFWHGGSWFVACLKTGEHVPIRQAEGYRFALLVGTAAEVDAAHAAAVEQQAKWDIREVRPVTTDGDTRTFHLRDLDGNWWEIYHRPQHLYDDVFARESVAAE